MKTDASRSASVRARLDHPVIDSGGHMVEVYPVMFDYLKQIGRPEIGIDFSVAYPMGGFYIDIDRR